MYNIVHIILSYFVGLTDGCLLKLYCLLPVYKTDINLFTYKR